jgi:hypothetical protein
MDVKKIDGGALSAMAGKKGKEEELEGLDFQKLLQEAQANRKPGEARNSPEGSVGKTEFFANSVLPFPSVNFVPGLPEISSLRSQGALATEKTLDLLEQYQRAIADPKVSLKEISPLAQSLSQEIKGLTQWAQKLSSSDPLQKIIAEVGIVSSVEVEKFNRGDHI